MRRFVFPLALALAAGSASAQLLESRNHRAFALPFLRMTPWTDRLAADSSEWSFSWTESNDVSKHTSGPRELYEDGEFTRLAVRYRGHARGVGEWYAEVPLTAFWGGAMDEFIEAFHDLLLGGNAPLRVATDPGEASVRLNGRTFGAESGIAGVTAGVIRPVGRNWVASVAAKLPTTRGNGLIDTGRVDVGAGLGWSGSLGERWRADVHAGVVRQGGAPAFGSAREWVNHQAAAICYRLNSKDTWILQFQSESSALRTGVSSSDAAHRSGALGYRRDLGRGRTLEAFIAEDYDPTVSLNSSKEVIGPDVVIGVMLRIRK